MKKLSISVLALLLVSTSAFASKARLQALGQAEDTGSHYIADSRSIFFNPAHINNFKNYAITEWGVANQNTGGTAATPNAEGGYFQEYGKFAFGAYFGSETRNITDTVKDGATVWVSRSATEGEFEEQKNPVDFFFGGDMGVKWGLRLHAAIDKDETAVAVDDNGRFSSYEAKNQNIGAAFGVIVNDLEAYVNLGIVDKAEGLNGQTNNINSVTSTVGNYNDKTTTLEADLDLNIGLAYNIFGLTIFADYRQYGWEYDAKGTAVAGVGGVADYERQTITLGLGKIHEVAKNARLFTDARFTSVTDEGKDAGKVLSNANATVASGTIFGMNGVADTATLTKVESSVNTLMATIGYEADATSWLTLRGSVAQSILVNGVKTKRSFHTSFTTDSAVRAGNDKTDQTNARTTWAAGATLNFGNLKVDGLIGNNYQTVSTATTSSLRTDVLMSRVAVHYWF